MIFKGIRRDIHGLHDILCGGAFDVGIKYLKLLCGQGLVALQKERQGLPVRIVVFLALLLGGLSKLCLKPFLDLIHKAALLVHNDVNAEQEQLAYDIGDREHFKIDGHHLLNKPNADVYKNGDSDDNGMSGGIHSLFNKGADNNGDHSSEISNEEEKIKGMEGAVNLNEGADAVHLKEADLLIVDREPSGACRNEEQGGAETEKAVGQPLFIGGCRNLQNDHKHGEGEHHLSEIGNAVCPERHTQGGGGGKAEVADVYNNDGRKHYDKPRAFLFKEKNVCRHHKAGENGSCAVYPCQACAFGSDDGAAGQAQYQRKQERSTCE